MKSKLVSLTIAATLALTGVSAYAAPAAKPAAPLKIGSTDSDGLTKYKGKTVVSGVLEYNMINEAMCQVCFTVDKKSQAMIPKKTKTSNPIVFATPYDNAQIKKLKLNENKCYSIPMTVEIDGYYAVNDGYGDFDGANIVKVVKSGKPATISCGMSED